MAPMKNPSIAHHHSACSCRLSSVMEAGQAEAEMQEPGPDAPRCPGAPEEGTDPRAPACPAAQTLGCPGGQQSRTGASGGSNTSKADRGPTAGRPTGLRLRDAPAQEKLPGVSLCDPSLSVKDRRWCYSLCSLRQQRRAIVWILYTQMIQRHHGTCTPT
ncbi:hypothetical protein F7725_024055 [Dissostichus mawsoni]|uniref:Uncharacterized protein n=1 Tax=Dissostichus mawsoni TaxID=36200 RepID=A0A7J5XY95_DISMA|nr:hypothetical protein F7725_024055 [Dissostichus mawsoni]